MQILWKERNQSGASSEIEEIELLATVRKNTAEIELNLVRWSNAKLAKPPRSGLWSNLYPIGVGWIFLGIVLALLVVWGVIVVFQRFSPN